MAVKFSVPNFNPVVFVVKPLSVNLKTDSTIIEKPTNPYTGEYEFTPTDTEIVVPTKNLNLFDDIKINPIPNNYGLITWNGSVITVS